MRVVCRLRPPRDGDCDREVPTPLVFTSGAVYSFDEGEFSGPRDSAYGRFDAVLGTRATQDECYNACCAGLIDGCVRGVSATVLAYGASGAGKTHSLVGAVTTDHNGYHHRDYSPEPYAVKVAPLTYLLSKKNPWKWGPEQQEAHKYVTTFLAKYVERRFPRWGERFILRTDAANSTSSSSSCVERASGNQIPFHALPCPIPSRTRRAATTAPATQST